MLAREERIDGAAHQIGDGSVFLRRQPAERRELLLGELDLRSHHAIMIAEFTIPPRGVALRSARRAAAQGPMPYPGVK